ncbi:Arginyl-tRNA synthetase [Euzebya pacifica]|uniref:Arginine--tRNA ligase n=1 Tax=Euzebya pacifica TaxID=1608957 RepID=A0A346Y1V9_9ACTN|nr:arginine--tRNA ligase [Euzebya pacifica]AXV08456.1 Arginyl-tRNA synthetase [Euzebya pacifica]
MIGPEQLATAVAKALADAGLPERTPTFERPKNRDHGDWSTNVALTLAKPVGRPPRDIAQTIVDTLGDIDGVDGVELAGPGFINFRLAQDAFGAIVRAVVEAGVDGWGRSTSGIGRSANIEFVSANPTGPLHVGHGRWVAMGDALANVLEATGWSVTREYYLNDAGNQITLLGSSVAARMRGEEVPEDGYRGAYITEIAEQLTAAGVDPDDTADVVARSVAAMTDQIRATMESIGIHIDVWFSEKTLHAGGAIDDTIGSLRDRGHAYDADGAVWLRTSDFGDDKDRVLVKADGAKTYFAADTAYLADKVARGFDLAIYLLGADHHGYVGRLHAIARAEGVPDGVVEVIIGQLVNLLRDGEPVRMGKRSGNFVTLDELVEEVGADATRYTFLRSSMDTPQDFDIARVVSEDKANPVHYINYSYARIAGIGRKAVEVDFDAGSVEDADLTLLTHDTEQELIRRIDAFGETVERAAADRAPHRVARYAEDVADAFHRFYTECQVIDAEAPELSVARFWLCEAARITVSAALGILGVTPRERM